ncbi:MAG: Twitching motility protein PilT [Labilithrix sp.]|nr:Twitching motility protein PilT [Labilithrix sp.]
MPKIDGLFDEVVKRGGSDLHLAGGYPPLARIRGDLVPLREAVVDGAELEEVLLELLTPAQRARLQADLDLDFAHTHKTMARFRANYFNKSSGLAAVFRLVPGRVLTLAELGCPEVLWRLADRRSGLVLVTGPTGSGKSTTLAAMVDHINKTRACHIVTIEDPIEFVHEPLRAQITHREVGVHAPSFVSAIRSAGRENSDVVLISELRTPETMKLALSLASQGVLVFATVQTNGAASTIDRIVDSFPADEQPQVRGMLAESLVGLVAQQLIRTADGKGRVAVHEILVGSGAVSALVRENKTAQLTNVMQSGQAQGMQTMDMALERLLTQNRIGAEDALDRAVDREGFAQVIARVRPDLAEILG